MKSFWTWISRYSKKQKNNNS